VIDPPSIDAAYVASIGPPWSMSPALRALPRRNMDVST